MRRHISIWMNFPVQFNPLKSTSVCMQRIWSRYTVRSIAKIFNPIILPGLIAYLHFVISDNELLRLPKLICYTGLGCDNSVNLENNFEIAFSNCTCLKSPLKERRFCVSIQIYNIKSTVTTNCQVFRIWHRKSIYKEHFITLKIKHFFCICNTRGVTISFERFKAKISVSYWLHKMLSIV